MRSLKGKSEVVAPISAPFFSCQLSVILVEKDEFHHVANCSHASARERVGTGSEVLDDGAGATLDGEDASDLQDNV